MSYRKQSSKRKRRRAAVPALGAAGLLLSLPAAHPVHQRQICRRETPIRAAKSFWLRRKSLTSAWRHSMSSTKKTADHCDPACNSSEAAAAAAAAVAAEGAEVVAAVEAVRAAVAVEAALALEAAPDLEAAHASAAQDAQWAGGATVSAASEPAVYRGEVAATARA